jgi:hypothetical protein
MTKRLFLAAVNRTVGYGIAAYVSALVGNQRARAFALGLEMGLVVGVVTLIVTACMPLIEWTAENMRARRMGVFGDMCNLIGFTLQ